MPRKRCALPHSRVMRVRLALFSSAALRFFLRFPARLSPPVPRRFACRLRLRKLIDYI